MVPPTRNDSLAFVSKPSSCEGEGEEERSNVAIGFDNQVPTARNERLDTNCDSNTRAIGPRSMGIAQPGELFDPDNKANS
jgi:hypothetical protein